jgi:hypothetical protein
MAKPRHKSYWRLAGGFESRRVHFKIAGKLKEYPINNATKELLAGSAWKLAICTWLMVALQVYATTTP